MEKGLRQHEMDVQFVFPGPAAVSQSSHSGLEKTREIQALVRVSRLSVTSKTSVFQKESGGNLFILMIFLTLLRRQTRIHLIKVSTNSSFHLQTFINLTVEQPHMINDPRGPWWSCGTQQHMLLSVYSLLKKKKVFRLCACFPHKHTTWQSRCSSAYSIEQIEKKNRHTEHKKHHLIHIGVTKNKHLYQVQASV